MFFKLHNCNKYKTLKLMNKLFNVTLFQYNLFFYNWNGKEDNLDLWSYILTSWTHTCLYIHIYFRSICLSRMDSFSRRLNWWSLCVDCNYKHTSDAKWRDMNMSACQMKNLLSFERAKKALQKKLKYSTSGCKPNVKFAQIHRMKFKFESNGC